jgi:hypothetical protein
MRNGERELALRIEITQLKFHSRYTCHPVALSKRNRKLDELYAELRSLKPQNEEPAE